MHWERLRLLFFLLLGARLAHPMELQIQFTALERLLAEQVFTQEGRRYVRGGKSDKCNFAYLEKPRVAGADGKLLMHARFTGRSSFNMFGQCVGLGDAFDVLIAASPRYRDGALGLENVTVVSEGHNGFYIRRVCAALSSSLAREFRYPIASAAKSLLEDPRTPQDYPRELHNFRVTEAHVANDALILAIDFELTVK